MFYIYIFRREKIMKRKQLCSLITAALLATSLVAMPGNAKAVQAKEKSSVAAASIDGLNCTYQPQINQTESNSITGNIYLENNSGSAIDLSTVKLNYYYSNDNNLAEEFHCYYSGTQNNVDGYHDFTSNISAKFFDNEDQSDSTKSRVCQISIGSGMLPAGEKIVIQMSFNGQGWSGNFIQDNDYSFKNGVVIDGKASSENPQGPVTPVKNPSAKLNTNSYKINSNAKVSAVIADGTLKEIRDNNKTLVKGRDYTISNGNVNFTNSYLDSLKEGSNTITFVFENGKVTTTLNVTKDSTAEVKDAVTIDVADDVKAGVGEEVLVPVTMSQFKGVDPIENYEFVVNYDSSKLEFVGVEGSGLTEKYGKLFQTKDLGNGSVKVQYLTEKEKQAISEDGTICVLKFKTKAKGTAKISLSDVVLSYFNTATGKADKYNTKLDAGSVIIKSADAMTVDVADDVKAEVGEEVLV
ncbi:MAG: hypothetical protein E7213_06340, partial [Clostridium sp.]|nr:hypothetical protein [Clostridium sp.]